MAIPKLFKWEEEVMKFLRIQYPSWLRDELIWIEGREDVDDRPDGGKFQIRVDGSGQKLGKRICYLAIRQIQKQLNESILPFKIRYRGKWGLDHVLTIEF